MTVLTDWNRSWSQLRLPTGKDTGDQHDFIIFDGDNNLIVLIEAKCTVDSQLNKALQQLKNQIEYFREAHGHVVTAEWQAACIIASKNLPKIDQPCVVCQNFLITLDTDYQLCGQTLFQRNRGK